MADVLRHLKPTGTILEVEPAKLGPVYAVAQAFHLINDDEPVIVNYCDFYIDWDYEDFKKNVKETGYDGDVVSYIGFHPHLLHEKNFYASCKVDRDHNLLEIREKYSYTSDKTQSPQSCGTYYFKKGRYIKKYFQQLMDEKIELNGEYYVSLIYNLMVRDRLKIHVYDKVRHFLQWGTPEDLEEYLYWSDIFERLAGKANDD
jgi:NDP-sugar pyrophosphorylase family protein